MFVQPGSGALVLSPSDLREAAVCEFALLRSLDVALGRGEPAAVADDPMLARLAVLGDAHEQQALRGFARSGRVLSIGRPRSLTADALMAAAAQTLDALTSDVDVVNQAVFFDGRFLGYADFVLHTPSGWLVADTKLARHDSVPALLQIAAYADGLVGAGLPVAPVARLILGDGDAHDHPLADILPVYRARRRRLIDLVEGVGADGPVAWGDERVAACGRCPECLAQLEATRDVLLVHGVGGPQRALLRAAGVQTIEDLAERSETVPDLRAATFERIRAQAALQARQDADGSGAVAYELIDPDELAVIPQPSPGDIFFDFEGDPLWRGPGPADQAQGLEYLFGIIEAPVGNSRPVYRAFWAHDRAGERQALADFLAYLRERRRQWPDLHVYHYADYERAALLRLAVRHATGEAEVDDLLRDGVLVDLYSVVRGALRVGQRSYSIKKLEPLYMGEDLRAGEVTSGSESIVVYHEYTQAVAEDRTGAAARLLEEIRDYNEYDCLSTLRLRDWLLDRADEAGVEIGRTVVPQDREPEEPHPIEQGLRALVPDVAGRARTDDEQALLMLSATLQYNRREAKPYWWAHFDRLIKPVDEWMRAADVFRPDHVEVVSDWAKAPGQRVARRRLRLVGRFLSGSAVRAGATLQTIYGAPLPDGYDVEPGQIRAKGGDVTVVERLRADDQDILIVDERPKPKAAPPAAYPLALTPGPGPLNTAADGALEELGARVLATGGFLHPQPGLDLLRRLPPRTRSGTLPAVWTGPDRFVDAIYAAVRDLDRSYLGVQGPPGTGKTYVAAHVITRLVTEHGWKVGVVAQSHAAVENVLDAVVKAGLDPALVAKNPADTEAAHPWTVIDKDAVAAFCADHDETGYVIGGTAWDLTSTRRVGRDQLDLVVVDEAGQYSLALTVACSVAGSRLLLLGDPQQLAQVSQGSHPEPIAQSALGWLLGDAPVIPAHLGYFLETSWRMHPAVTSRVSRLSYAGALRSQEAVTGARSLAGVRPGVHVERVAHVDNARASAEEAQRVLELVDSLVGSEWLDGDGPARPLEPSDIRVVTPFNEQVALIADALQERGFGDVAVASVDKAQGQESPVVILSLASSSGATSPRGTAFLLERNRLNVAISRAQWAAYVVCSEHLTDFSPRSPRELLAVGAFLGLIADEPEDLTQGSRGRPG